MQSTQQQALAALWPRTFAALQMTYYPGDAWTQTTEKGQNDAGYVLQGLARAASAAIHHHGHKGVSKESFDYAAANEVFYQHGRGSLFRRPCAALSACWQALVTERPEKLYNAVSRERRNRATI